MSVNTGGIGEEVLKYGESRCDGSIFCDVLLDGIFAEETVAGCGEVFVSGVINGSVGLTGFFALWSYLCDIVTTWKSSALNVVSALFHSVIEAEFAITVISSSHDSLATEPGPWGSNLATIASH